MPFPLELTACSLHGPWKVLFHDSKPKVVSPRDACSRPTPSTSGLEPLTRWVSRPQDTPWTHPLSADPEGGRGSAELGTRGIHSEWRSGLVTSSRTKAWRPGSQRTRVCLLSVKVLTTERGKTTSVCFQRRAVGPAAFAALQIPGTLDRWLAGEHPWSGTQTCSFQDDLRGFTAKTRLWGPGGEMRPRLGCLRRAALGQSVPSPRSGPGMT